MHCKSFIVEMTSCHVLHCTQNLVLVLFSPIKCYFSCYMHYLLSFWGKKCDIYNTNFINQYFKKIKKDEERFSLITLMLCRKSTLFQNYCKLLLLTKYLGLCNFAFLLLLISSARIWSDFTTCLFFFFLDKH